MHFIILFFFWSFGCFSSPNAAASHLGLFSMASAPRELTGARAHARMLTLLQHQCQNVARKPMGSCGQGTEEWLPMGAAGLLACL